ncbi:hypothetical protein BHE74_00008465 [Ensete ventricosum]|nr:hypothetical protein GW17_00037323 [Ensete ventricosum]RWW83045.1 hypothetical protein BHE74_00008465 [Ensete ventricosum]RZR90382.1 hypothetical protein BHM03_00018273 [Ensete ventricosum]
MSASAERDPDRRKEVVGVRLSLLFPVWRASDPPAQHEDKEISEEDQVGMRLAGATKCSPSPVFCSRLPGVIGGYPPRRAAAAVSSLRLLASVCFADTVDDGGDDAPASRNLTVRLTRLLL